MQGGETPGTILSHWTCGLMLPDTYALERTGRTYFRTLRTLGQRKSRNISVACNMHVTPSDQDPPQSDSDRRDYPRRGGRSVESSVDPDSSRMTIYVYLFRSIG